MPREWANFIAINLADDVIKGRRSVSEARQQYADLVQAYMRGDRPVYSQGLQFDPPPLAQAHSPGEALIRMAQAGDRQTGRRQPGQADEMRASVDAPRPPFQSETITIPSVTMPQPGFVAVRPMLNNRPAGPGTIGYAEVPAGRSENIQVELNYAPVAGESYAVMLQANTDNDGQFEYEHGRTNVDVPLTRQGRPVMDVFTAETATAGRQGAVMPLAQFDQRQFQNSWTAENMLGSDVYGEDGSLVGEVANIIIGPNGTIDRLVVSTDNFLGIGDRMVSVPQNNVTLTPGEAGIRTRLDEDQMDDFSLFAEEEVRTGPRAFRVSDLMGDYVRLQNGRDYGYVTDVVFGRDGNLQAVLVQPDITFDQAGYAGGAYAYPFYGYDYGFEPLEQTYDLPYDETEVAEYEPIEDGMFDGDLF